MVTAFVLINVEDQMVNTSADALLRMPGVSEVHIVAGEYDIVAVVRVADNATLANLLTNEIIRTPGVHRTKTLISLRGQANFDLALLGPR
ncbi:MAG: leucine-responsive transcriptional regulator [Lentisphaerae bacterium ADurb.BinA184]|nr:MAG: leucine-responsive transcriptional regulator [Lentisphaerae bacterium ADurb.BinA184]